MSDQEEHIECTNILPMSVDTFCALMDAYWVETERQIEIAAALGYRPKTHGDAKATHAICRHGVIMPVSADHHTCSWMPLVESNKPTIKLTTP